MLPVFADACYWIALLLERDALHRAVLRLSNEMAHRGILTSEMVLAEFLNSVSRYGPEKRQAAVELIRSFQRSHRVNIVEQSTERFWSAVELYNARPDQEWGLVDCASFQLMRERNIQEALTNDHHFEQAGFTILMQ